MFHRGHPDFSPGNHLRQVRHHNACIALVPGNPRRIEGRAKGQRTLTVTQFVKQK
jgi:hypothetical protein